MFGSDLMAAAEWDLSADDLAEIDRIIDPPAGPAHG